MRVAQSIITVSMGKLHTEPAAINLNTFSLGENRKVAYARNSSQCKDRLKSLSFQEKAF